MRESLQPTTRTRHRICKRSNNPELRDTNSGFDVGPAPGSQPFRDDVEFFLRLHAQLEFHRLAHGTLDVSRNNRVRGSDPYSIFIPSFISRNGFNEILRSFYLGVTRASHIEIWTRTNLNGRIYFYETLVDFCYVLVGPSYKLPYFKAELGVYLETKQCAKKRNKGKKKRLRCWAPPKRQSCEAFASLNSAHWGKAAPQ